MRIDLARPWMVVDLGAPHRVLSWALHRPGLVTARHVAWREVRDADLTEDLDAAAWLAGEMARRGLGEEVGLLTSRNLARHHVAHARAGEVRADCIATVGLSNAERVGTRHAHAKIAGTINIVACVNGPLSEAALVEALSIAVEARTVAVAGAGIRLAGGTATGTGTDCVAVAAPHGPGAPYAGKHTAAGEAIGAAVLSAVGAGVAEWLREKAAGAID